MKNVLRNIGGAVKALAAAAMALALSCTAWALEWNDGTYTWSYVVNGDGTVRLFKSDTESAISPDPAGVLEVPSKIDGKTLKEIGSSAFKACSMTAVTIPDSVTKIGAQAFNGCNSLTEVTIPAGVTSIGEYAFSDCAGLARVVIPSGVTSIGQSAFANCAVLNYVTVPDSVTSIGDGAFSNCPALEHVVVPAAFDSNGEKVRIYGKTTDIDARDVKVEIVDGVAWAYMVSGDEATVGGGADDYAVLPDAAVKALAIPATLGGCPVTAIGKAAFYNCNALTSVTIPSGVTSIESYAFSGCGLKSMTIPASVTTVGLQAFYDCNALKRVTIPSGVTSIGKSAFSSCAVLDYVTVPDSVTEIKDYAFSNCDDLDWAVVPTAFGSDSEKTRIFGKTSGISARDVKVEIVDGICWSYTVSGGEATVGGGAGDYAISPSTAGELAIPATLGGCPVTAIGKYAFDSCEYLTSVTIPSGVTSIGEYAFKDCYELTSVTIPDGVTTIGQYAFSGCSKLASLELPDSITSIANAAFMHCECLTSVTIPAGVTDVETRVFDGCALLETVTIPAGVTSIDARAFADCGALQEFIVAEENADYKAVDGLLLSRDGKTLVHGVGGDVVIPDGVETIGDNAFDGLVGLTSVVIPDSVTKIGEAAFSGCDLLASVVIPSGMTDIGDWAFYKCDALTQVIVPASVTTIGDYAFAYCANLTYALLPTSFNGDPNLADIFDSTPAYPSDITYANYGVEVVDGIPWYYTVSGGEATLYALSPEYIQGAVTIPSTLGGYPVTTIGIGAFDGCSGLTSVAIPSGVTSIKLSAFEGCTGLESVVVPDSATIDNAAFKDCTSLLYALVPAVYDGSASLASIFENCPAHADGEIYFSDVKVAVVDGLQWIYTVDGDKAVLGSGIERFAAIPKDTADDLVIPATLGGYPVTAIGEEAFSECEYLTSVTIPEGVTTIAENAFLDCYDLEVVTISATATDINPWAFDGCGVLQEFVVAEGNAVYKSVDGLLLSKDGKKLVKGVIGDVTIPDGVETIGDGAFYCLSGLSSVTIPDGVKAIEDYAFDACDGLAEVALPDSLTSLGDSAFAYSGITSVAIPSGVTTIEGDTFNGCDSLESVVIPSGVTMLGERAFNGCDVLASVTVPDSVTAIGDGAFADCAILLNAVLPKSFEGNPAIAGIFDSSPTAVEYRDVKVEVVDGVVWIYIVSGGKATLGGGADDLAVLPTTDGDIVIPVTLGGYPVTGIGESAFHDIPGLTGVAVPSGVTAIGDGAFANCTSLSYAILPGAFKDDPALGGIFSGCPAYPDDIEFLDIDIVDGLIWVYTVVDGKAVLGDGDGGQAIPQDTAGDLVIPATLGGCPVTGIGDYAFEGCGYLTGVTIPSGVKAIGDGAFSDCMSLAAMTIPNGVTAIGDYAFDGCTDLANLTIGDGVEVIGEYAFNGCTSLEDIEIPGSVKSIGESAFDDCVALTSVTIGDGVEEIGDYAFLDCADLEAVELPASVTILGKGAFKGCLSLTDVTLSEGLTALPDLAFSGCSSMTEITIPESVTTVGANAFDGCSGLTVTAPWALKDKFTVPAGCTIEYYGAPTPPAPTTCMVVFDENCSDDVDVSESARTVPGGSAIGELPTATRTGWTLDGWYTAATGGTKVDATFVVTEDMTLYAHWTENGGGSGGEGEGGGSGGEGEGGGSGGEGEGGEGEGKPVAPCYEKLEMDDITAAYEAPKAVTLHGAVYDGCDVVAIVELKLGKVNAKKGTSKIGGSVTLLDGKKITIKAVTVSGIDGKSPVTVSLEVKGRGTMHVAIGGTTFAGSLGDWHVQSASVGVAWGGASAAVSVEADDMSAFPGNVLADLLPAPEVADVNKGKWAFKKAAGVKWAKPKKGAELPEIYDAESGKGLIVDTSKGKTNLSGMKLTYTPKKGTFKGSFKVYELQGSGKKTKLKKYTVKVSGVVADGVGYGTATCKKPAVRWAVTVK